MESISVISMNTLPRTGRILHTRQRQSFFRDFYGLFHLLLFLVDGKPAIVQTGRIDSVHHVLFIQFHRLFSGFNRLIKIFCT